jgi:hypothetical protein
LALGTWLLGGYVPGGDKFKPKGFLLEEIGPAYQVGKGKVEMEEWVKILTKERTAGCPFKMD